MLYAFGFERVGVVVGDLYFDNPRAARGQEGAEHGVRLELRMLERAHHHPAFTDWNLGRPPQDQDTDIIRTGWL